MVSLSQVQQTNASAASKLPAGLVAIFAGATAGIGEAALKAFAKYTTRPRIYYIGRSQEAGDGLQSELKELNPEGEYIFIKKDMSLLKNVDEVCRDIKSKETVLNVLFLSQGTLRIGVGKFPIKPSDHYFAYTDRLRYRRRTASGHRPNYLLSQPSRSQSPPTSKEGPVSSSCNKRHGWYTRR